jgi:hypothetical protein
MIEKRADSTEAVALPGRVLAIARDYQGIHAACRTRADELEITRETLDATSGMQGGYSGKLLAPKPVKRAGPITLPLLLGGLGLALAVVEDPDALDRVKSRLVKRRRPPANRASTATPAEAQDAIRLHLSTIGRRGARSLNKALSARQRQRAARKAALARWSPKGRKKRWRG